MKSLQRICTCVQSLVSGMLAFEGPLQLSVVPGQVPPPAAFVASGSVVLSMLMLNENVPVPDEPRTQKEIPLYVEASAQPIQTPPPIPQADACATLWEAAQLLGGCPGMIDSAGAAVPSPKE